MHQKKIKSIFGLVTILFLLLSTNSTSSAQGIEKPPLKIVQLGDSYSAGNGARSESGDFNYYSVEGCYRSPTNWGSQFVGSLKDTFAVTYINRACSGGVVANILNERDMEDTSLKNWDGSCPSEELEYPDEEFYKDTSALNCSRFIKPQIDAIDNSVDLVLMTMGGNDLGFGNIVTQCFAEGPRDAVGCREAVDNANAKMTDLEDDLTNTFAAIRAKLRPDAKIVYVSYPQLLLDIHYEIVNWAGTPLEDRYDAGTALRALGVTGETHQRAAVEAANAAAGEDYIVFYDGTKALFEGHEPNPSSEERNPDRWINEFFESTKTAEWYHPNPLGHENWGRALSVFETFGAAGGTFEANADIDVVFVVDTTGSMGGEIAEVRANLSSLVDQLEATTDSYRVAVVSYRDFPQRTGWNGDYPSRVDQTFTDDLVLLQAAIDSLTANGGGDTPETVFSGIQTAIELPWRPGVTKTAIVIGDAPALSPEPISGLTASQIVANSIAVDPVQVIGVNVGSLNSNGALGQITDGTGGSVIQGTSGLTTTISDILASAANQPFAWLGQAYSGKIGQPILFDASGSYDPSGLPITLYEWDFNGDGIFDLETEEATAIHVYDAAFNDYVGLRVTSAGGTALASARTVVNAEGFAPQGGDDACALDENGFSIITDENGIFINCTADSLPESDQEGVTEILGSTPDLIFSDGFESGDFSAWYWATTDGGDLSVSTKVAAVGTKSMQALIDDNNEIILYDHTPNNEKHFSARFYFNPNSVQIPYNQGLYVFAGSDETSWAFCLNLEKEGANYTLALCGHDDSGAWLHSAPVLIPNAWQAVEVEWQAASGPSTRDGYLKLWINDTLVKSITKIDNDTRSISKTSLGVTDIQTGTSGTMYFDAFESHRGTHIGLDPNGPTVTPPPQPGDSIFADNFDSGSLSAWSSTVTDGGNLSVVSTAAYQKSAYGLKALINDQNNLRVIDGSPLDDTHYRARFYFHPNSITMTSGNAHYIFDGIKVSSSDAVVRVELIRESGVYKLRARVMNDAYSYVMTSKFTISNGWHAIEVEWQASSSSGKNDGFLTLWIDGAPMQTLSAVDNDTHTIGEIRLGAVSGLDTGTSGSMYFDKFESRRNTYIGP